MTQTKVILLGTGSPSCLPGYYQAAAAVIVDDRVFIVDCGGGTIQRLSEAAARYELAALEFPRLTTLFLTHLHPDHTVGLADFLIAPWVKGRTAPVHIFGPQKTQQLVDGLLQAYEPGIAEHRDGLAPISGQIEVNVSPLKQGIVLETEEVVVEAFPVSHGSLEAYGLKFTTADGVIVISGDTRPLQTLIDQAAGCDLLIHEVYNVSTLLRRSPEWIRYFQATHTSTYELAEIARQAKPARLVTTHNIFFPPDNVATTLKEITDLYDGPVAIGRDLEIYEI